MTPNSKKPLILIYIPSARRTFTTLVSQSGEIYGRGQRAAVVWWLHRYPKYPARSHFAAAGYQARKTKLMNDYERDD